MAAGSVLRGELGLLSLFDLGQLLMLNRATGELTVNSDGRRGYFYFDAGAIVNAVDDEYHEGEGAAYRLFTWKSGSFDFVPSPATGSRAIDVNTEGLMMEAARRMDESGASGTSHEAAKLAARASSLEALREVFQSLATESSGHPGAGEGGTGSMFDLLRDPGDALLLRPDAPPRLRSHGRWRALDREPLDSLAYEALRARLLDGAPAAAHDGAPRAHVTTLESGRRCSVTHVAGPREALWLRAAGLAPTSSARLDGELVVLDGVLARRAGLLLVAGPDAATAERLFHACIARLLDARGTTVLLAADHERWAHAERAGALVHAPGDHAAELARATSPDVAAFDLAQASHAPTVLSTVRRVIAAVVSPDAAGALTRWCALAGRRWGDGIETLLEGATVEVVLAPRAPGADGRLAFTCERIFAGPDALADAGPTEDALPAAGADDVAGTAAGAEAPAGAHEGARDTIPIDAMAELARELGRTLRKAA